MNNVKSFESYNAQDMMSIPTSITTNNDESIINIACLKVEKYFDAMEKIEDVLKDLGYNRQEDTGNDYLMVSKHDEEREYWYTSLDTPIFKEVVSYFEMPKDFGKFINEIAKKFENIEL